MGGRIGDQPAPDQAVAPVGADVVLVAERRDREVDLGVAPVERLGLGVLTVQRASRSFCRSLAGLARQASGTRPSQPCFSALLLRCLGAETMVASTSCPDMAR